MLIPEASTLALSHRRVFTERAKHNPFAKRPDHHVPSARHIAAYVLILYTILTLYTSKGRSCRGN